MSQKRRPAAQRPKIPLQVMLLLLAIIAWSAGSYARHTLPTIETMCSPLAQVLSGLAIGLLLAPSSQRCLKARWLQGEADGISHARRLALMIAIAAPMMPAVAMVFLVLLVGAHLPWSLLDLVPLAALVRALTAGLLFTLPAYLRVLLLGGLIPAAAQPTFERGTRAPPPSALPLRPLAPRAPPALPVGSD